MHWQDIVVCPQCHKTQCFPWGVTSVSWSWVDWTAVSGSSNQCVLVYTWTPYTQPVDHLQATDCIPWWSAPSLCTNLALWDGPLANRDPDGFHLQDWHPHTFSCHSCMHTKSCGGLLAFCGQTMYYLHVNNDLVHCWRGTTQLQSHSYVLQRYQLHCQPVW